MPRLESRQGQRMDQDGRPPLPLSGCASPSVQSIFADAPTATPGFLFKAEDDSAARLPLQVDTVMKEDIW